MTAPLRAEPPAGGAARRSRFRIDTACCTHCDADVGSALRDLPGIRSVEVLAAAGEVVVEHDARASVAALRRQAASWGVSLAPIGPSARHEDSWWREPRVLTLAAAAGLFVLGLALELLAGGTSAAVGLYLGALLVGGVYPLRSAVSALRARRLTISMLLVVAAAGAVALGVYEEAALLVVIYSLGGVLEAYVSDRARGSLRALMALAPPLAQRRRADGSLETVPVEEVEPGELVVVRPGERLPTDGVVVNGGSAIDQSPITGESIPVEVAPESQVFGGTINGNGVLEVRATKAYADTTLARIIRQVAEAQASKGRAQRFADRFGAVYTPLTFALAIGVALAALVTGDAREWIYRALVVLVVSCSCGLIMSVPAAVVAAVSRAARDGILIKGGMYLERLGSVRAVAFDKTGTLTRGRPHLTDALSLNGAGEEELLRIAAAVEAASEHPLAEAILAAARERGLSFTPATEARAIPGRGIGGRVDGRRVFLGKASDGNDHAAATAAALEQEGKTAILVADNGRPLGLLAVADELRSEAPAIVGELHQLGIGKVLMLSGDNERVAAAIAREAGIDDWRASLLPEQKTQAIQSLQAEHGTIAMVGDGVNDAPALATTDLGIAMGAAGTDVALETADVALMADDLRKLPQAIRLSRRAMRNIRQNIALSLATVALLLAGALGGYLSLTAGLLLNEGAALLIIANALRLLRAED